MKIKSSLLAKTESGLEISYAIRDSIVKEKPPDYEELFVLSERIRLCNDTGNNWIANDLHNQETGELYNGCGRFWTCGSKLCPFCIKRQSRKNRKNLELAIKAQRLLIGEDFRFITLTMPRQKLPLLECRKIINYSFVLFRKRKFFKETFIGTAKSEEFTVNKKGFNYHIHMLARTRYIPYHKLRSEWTECLRISFAKFGREISIATADGMAICHSQKITSITDAVNEVCKYITKSDSWRKLRAADLLDICRIRRFPRMFELLGSFKLPKPNKQPEDLGEDADTILDTKTLSDGIIETDYGKSWRRQFREIGASDYLAKLENEISDQFHYRVEQLHFRYPYAMFFRMRQTWSFNLSDAIKFLQKFKPKKPAPFENLEGSVWEANEEGIHQRIA